MRNVASLFFAAGALSALLSTGCSSMVPFTYELRSAHRLTDDEVRNLQFYASHEITLRREVQSQDSQVTPGHTLRLISGKSVEEVVIPAKTPGVATHVSPERISVSFVSGTSLDFLTGGPMPLGLQGDFLQPFAVAEGTHRPRTNVSASFLGQTYAEPPGQPARPVKIVNDPGRRPRPVDVLGGTYVLAVEGGQVPFAGVLWDAIDDTAKAHLLIDADKLEETEEKRTVLPGVRLGD